MHRIATAALAFCIGASAPVRAHEDFGPIKLKAGQSVQVTEGDVTLHGTVTSVAPSERVVNDHDLLSGPGC